MKKKSKYIVVIPARLKSTRLPNKPLLKIKGKEMILRTYEQCAKVINKTKIFVATDSKLIFDLCKRNSIQVLLTSSSCLTGTDRIAEVAKKIKANFYINVQGDEPIFNPIDLKKLIKFASLNSDQIINGYTKIETKKDFFNINIPKVALTKKNNLLYMSRAPIPFNKKKFFKLAYRQVCAYSFPRKVLLEINKNNKKTKFESIEDIEILRFLELGYNIKMICMSNKSIAVDTKEDLKRVSRLIK